MEAKAEWERRSAFVDSLRDDLSHLTNAVPKCVFVSYCYETGKPLFDLASRVLRELGFEVVTGFDEIPEESRVIRRILAQLRKSSVFLGILTKTLEATVGGRHMFAPSVWTVEEKGMALALGKPVVLLVEDGIHDDFWLRTAPHRVHYKFNKENFNDKLDLAAQAALERYSSVVRRQL